MEQERKRVRRLTHEERGLKTRAQMIRELQDQGMVNISRASLAQVRAEHQRIFGGAGFNQ